MNFYRLVHGKSFWIFLAVILGMVALSTGLMTVITSPGFLESMQAASSGAAQAGITFGITGPDGGMMDSSDYTDVAQATALLSGNTTQLAFVGSMFLSGGALSCMVVIFLAIFLASEFESGFVKNVFTAQPSRLAFLSASVVEVIVLALVFTVFTVATTLGAAALLGLDLAPTPLPDLLLWTALVALMVAGFGMMTALAVWLTRKMAVGIVAGIVLASGLVTFALQAALLLFPSASHLADFTLTSCMASLAQGVNIAGGLSAAHIAVVGAAFVVVCAAIGAVALQKKDI